MIFEPIAGENNWNQLWREWGLIEEYNNGQQAAHLSIILGKIIIVYHSRVDFGWYHQQGRKTCMAGLVVTFAACVDTFSYHN